MPGNELVVGMTGTTQKLGLQIGNVEQVDIAAFPGDSPVVNLDRYWRSIWPGPDRLPGRRHFDPIEIEPAILPWIFLVEVLREADGMDFLFRLVGTGNVTLVGRDATGRRASEVFGKAGAPFLIDTFKDTVTSATPTFWTASVPNDRFGHVSIHRGLFPLAGDGETVDMLLCMAAPWPAY